jgi:hypothetical protein
MMADYALGDRVEIHPACDAWMMGDRFGTIVKIGRQYLHVKMDRSSRTLSFAPSRIYGKV